MGGGVEGVGCLLRSTIRATSAGTTAYFHPSYARRLFLIRELERWGGLEGEWEIGKILRILRCLQGFSDMIMDNK